jgi:hypothetical protein
MERAEFGGHGRELPLPPLSTCYVYCDCDAMRRRSTGRLIFSIHFAFVASAAALEASCAILNATLDLELRRKSDPQRPVPA